MRTPPITLERRLPAPRATVYRALTDPAILARWWGPHGFTAPSVEFESQVGRGFRIAMQPPAGELFHVSGQFTEVQPPVRLAYTFRWHPPHPDDRETTAALILRPQRGGTHLSLTQGEFANLERHALHKAGWAESFERLEQLLRGPLLL